jgi:hypothetical protein
MPGLRPERFSVSDAAFWKAVAVTLAVAVGPPELSPSQAATGLSLACNGGSAR